MSETQYSIISLLPAFIWAIVPLFYKEFLNNNSTIKVNFYRMLFASLALFIPFLYLGFNEGIIFGMLSGILTLAIGDSFYLLSIRKVGASIAAPVSYTYVFFSQIAAFVLGEKILQLIINF
jgi:DME family drug/metabolite transporter